MAHAMIFPFFIVASVLSFVFRTDALATFTYPRGPDCGTSCTNIFLLGEELDITWEDVTGYTDLSLALVSVDTGDQYWILAHATSAPTSFSFQVGLGPLSFSADNLFAFILINGSTYDASSSSNSASLLEVRSPIFSIHNEDDNASGTATLSSIAALTTNTNDVWGWATTGSVNSARLFPTGSNALPTSHPTSVAPTPYPGPAISVGSSSASFGLGAYIGIGIGCAVFGLLIFGALPVYFWRRKRLRMYMTDSKGKGKMNEKGFHEGGAGAGSVASGGQFVGAVEDWKGKEKETGRNVDASEIQPVATGGTSVGTVEDIKETGKEYEIGEPGTGYSAAEGESSATGASLATNEPSTSATADRDVEQGQQNQATTREEPKISKTSFKAWLREITGRPPKEDMPPAEGDEPILSWSGFREWQREVTGRKKGKQGAEAETGGQGVEMSGTNLGLSAEMILEIKREEARKRGVVGISSRVHGQDPDIHGYYTPTELYPK